MPPGLPLEAATTPLQPVAVATGVAIAGIVAGLLVSRATSWLLGSLVAGALADGSSVERGVPTRTSRFLPAVAGLVALAVFVWEVVLQGQMPQGVVGEEVWWRLLARFAAHGVLGSLLAMATLVDLRYRVIPDCITVPGTLAGLLLVTLIPEILLPVACEVPREYAPPLLIRDVLGAFGPLACGSAENTGTRPWLAMLGFVAWWSVCTSPTAGVRPWRDIRFGILAAGLVAVACVSLGETTTGRAALRASGLEASLLGAIVSGGLVLATRAAASRAVGREAMGMGDVTLMAMVGSWCGWQAGVVAFFLAAFIGLVQGAWGWLRHRDNELPYGPSLSLASVAVILGWRHIWEMGRPLLEAPAQMAATLIVVVVLTGLTLAVWARLRGR